MPFQRSTNAFLGSRLALEAAEDRRVSILEESLVQQAKGASSVSGPVAVRQHEVLFDVDQPAEEDDKSSDASTSSSNKWDSIDEEDLEVAEEAGPGRQEDADGQDAHDGDAVAEADVIRRAGSELLRLCPRAAAVFRLVHERGASPVHVRRAASARTRNQDVAGQHRRAARPSGIAIP